MDLGTTAPVSYQSLSSERSDVVNIIGGTIDGVTIGSNSTINAPISGPITGATITGGSINNTPIGQSTPAAGAFTGLNATSAGILGPLSAQGVNSTGNGQAASITNSGTYLSNTFSSLRYYDSSRTANNKTHEEIWSSGGITFRFVNDAGNAYVPWLIAAGGQGSGITSINSDSGAGSWIHTGNFALGTAGKGFQVKEGSNSKQGTAILVAGTVTVANTSVTSSSRIFLTVQSLGTVTKPQAVGVTARTAGTSFVITSFDATDTSVVAYEIFEPAP